MSERIFVGTPPLEIEIQRNARARRLTLRIGPSGPRMTVPKRCKLADAEDFARRKLDWITARLERAPTLKPIDFGRDLPVLGRMRRIAPRNARSIKIDDDYIYAPETKNPAPAIAQTLKAMARDELVAQSDFFAAKLGRPYARISLRDTRSRWGSCTSAGNLMYSWRLIMTPPEVLTYVAAHEVAHLAHLDHSQAFWDTVERLLPGFGPQRQWLKTHGAEIQSYQFKT